MSATATQNLPREEEGRLTQTARKALDRAKERKVPTTQLYVNGNPREDHNIEPIVESIRVNGFFPNMPLLVVETDTGYLVVRGNRRFLAVQKLKADYTDDYKITFPSGKIPCLVVSDATPAEIEALRLDFNESAGEQKLSKWEQFLMTCRLFERGFDTETEIAQQFGKSRGWAQDMKRLWKMPVDVQESFKPVMSGDKDSSGLRISHIKDLWKPFSNYGDSEEFRERFEELKSRGNTGKPKPITASQLKNSAKSVGSPLYDTIAHTISGSKNAESLDNMVSAIISVEQKAAFYDDLRDAADGEQFEKLQEMVRSYRQNKS